MSAGPTRLRTRPSVQAADAAAERLTRRRRSVRRRRWLKVGAVIAAVALVAGVVWAVVASPLLAVTSVDVVGTHRTTADQVRDAADVPRGQPLARLDLDAVQRRVAALPGIASVTVTREWPHTVRVTVVERVPSVTRRSADGTWLVLDATGVVVGQTTAQPSGLVWVDLDPATTDTATMTAAVAVAASLPKSLRAKVDRVTANSPDDVRLALVDGHVVRWGNADDAGLKAQVLAALLTRPARVYDVSAPLAPTTGSG
jgi:cell division protein FtsQ